MSDKPMVFNYQKYEDLLERTRWIPVSERLPEKDEEVLITAWGRVEGVAWVDKYGLWQTETYTFHNNEDVTAWMPLPEPYKGGDEE